MNREAFTRRSSYTQRAFRQRSFNVHTGSRNCSCKTQSRRESEKKDDLRTLLNMNFKGKSSVPKWRQVCCQSTIATSLQSLPYARRLASQLFILRNGTLAPLKNHNVSCKSNVQTVAALGSATCKTRKFRNTLRKNKGP